MFFWKDQQKLSKLYLGWPGGKKKEREKCQIAKIKNEREDIINNLRETKRNSKGILWKTIMDEFLERHRQPELTQGETENLSRHLTV